MKSAGVKFLLLFTLILSANLFAQTPYDVIDGKFKPEKKLVHDFGNMFDAAQRDQLERKLVAYNDSTSVQITVVTFQKLDGYPIELLANEIGEKWGVGQKDQHNGIVIVLSNDDRKVTLRGGYGIQAKMPPTVEKLIIDQEMIPSFKQGDYYGGVDNATTAISRVLAGKYKAEPKKDKGDSPYGFLFFFIFIGCIILFIIIASKGGGGGNGGNRGRRGFDWTDVILTSGGASNWGRGWGGGSSGGGGGFGGGGFGGFGGGSFGGGGASGSW